MGSKKKKKRGGSLRNKGRAPSKDHSSQVCENNECVSEEITALCGIFQEDCVIVSNSPPQIDVKLRPYLKDTGYDDDLDISAILSIRYLPDYPYKCPKLQIKPERGLSRSDADKLLSLLHDQANSNAREGRVMIYNLVEAAREFISEIHPASQPPETFIEPEESSRLDLSIVSNGTSLPNGPFVYIDLFSGLSDLWNWGPEMEDTKSSSHPYPLNQIVKQMEVHDNKQVQPPNPTKEKLNALEERGEDDANNMLPPDLNISSSAESTASDYTYEEEELETLFESDEDQLNNKNEISVSSASVSDQLAHPVETDLFLAHLLRHTYTSRGALEDVLQEVTSELCSLGIISESVCDLANKPPVLFDKTFNEVFARRKVSSKISKYWKKTSEIKGDDSTPLPTSRYLNDFEELQPIGRGGFGHVVLCKNKLDGRQYAVKKIQMKDKSPPVNDRIIREVATLSRLQHLHVVRYYQAWFESGLFGPVTEAISGSTTMMSPSFSNKETSSASSKNKMESTYLYIQMEYCPRTLREMFDSYNHFEKDMAWHLFRQIVEGLAHIHAQGIIHRDLTPNNIFFDARNDIKIGDFGLAKFLQREQLEQDSDPVESTAVSVDRTGQVGTYFYTAPEIDQGWPKIDEKADMYSLGIVFFELWHPFGTAMERYVILSDLKLKSEAPSSWVSEFPEQASLLKRLLSSSPSNRPSATELIQHAFPPRMEYELLDNFLRTMHASEDKTIYDKIVNAVFDESSHVSTYTSSNIRYDDFDAAEVRDGVVDLTVQVFKRYCAKRFEISPLTLLSDNHLHNRNAVKLLARSGNMIKLCHELRLPFVKWVVAKQRTSFKRYEISHVYRKSIGCSAPNRYLQADFDIIGGETALTEAEAIKVTMDIVTQCFDSESWEIHLNHGKLLEAIWSWIGVKPGHRQKVSELLSILCSLRPQSSERKSKRVVIRRQLRQELNLKEATVNRLQTVESRFCEYADQALPRLRGALPADNATRNALDELTELFNCLRRWRIDKHVFIDALMPPSESYHRDIYFQIQLRNNNIGWSHTEGTVLAIGGRYDYLLKQMWNHANKSNPPGAVGVSIALETIIRHSAIDSRHDVEVSVLVCSRGGGGLLEERMELAAELWEEGISAQLVPVSDPSFTEQYEYANEHGIRCLVIITEVGLSQGSVKVRHLDLKKEKDVRKEKLIKFLLEATETQFRNPSIWN